jgi:hypothetical protein
MLPPRYQEFVLPYLARLVSDSASFTTECCERIDDRLPVIRQAI